MDFTPSLGPPTHPLACPRRTLMDSFFTTGTLADWLKLVLIGNFFNAQLLLSVVFYTWEALARRFYTTVEFDEFDSTFCEQTPANPERMALIVYISHSLDQHLVGTTTRMVHCSTSLYYNSIFRPRYWSFQTVRRVSRWEPLFRGPQSQEATVVLRHHLLLVQEPLSTCHEDKSARHCPRRTPDTQDTVGVQRKSPSCLHHLCASMQDLRSQPKDRRRHSCGRRALLERSEVGTSYDLLLYNNEPMAPGCLTSQTAVGFHHPGSGCQGGSPGRCPHVPWKQALVL